MKGSMAPPDAGGVVSRRPTGLELIELPPEC